MDKHARRCLSLLLQHSSRGWQLMGAVPEPEDAPVGPVRELVRNAADARLVRWRGFPLQLHPDGCDDYWFNVTSRQPLLFVICQPGDDDEPRPVRISADQEDGVAASEVEGIVFETPMPPPLVLWVRDYVAAYWQPGPRKNKRKPREEAEQ